MWWGSRKHQDVGKKFNSPFFGKNIIVTKVKNDNKWWFRFEGDSQERKASTELSYFKKNGLEVKEENE